MIIKNLKYIYYCTQTDMSSISFPDDEELINLIKSFTDPAARPPRPPSPMLEGVFYESRNPSGYSNMLKRLGELNALLPEGSAKVATTDQGFQACKVLGADGKVQVEASIARLEGWFRRNKGV